MRSPVGRFRAEGIAGLSDRSSPPTPLAPTPWRSGYASTTPDADTQPSEGNPRPADRHERPPGSTRPSETAAEGLIQIAKQLPDAPSTRRCRGVAAEHLYDGWCRAPASLLDVLHSADISIIARHKLGRSRRMGRCPQNVLHLVGVGQWMQVRGGCRAHRCSRRIDRGRGICVSRRPVRRPRGVAQCLPALTTPRNVHAAPIASRGRESAGCAPSKISSTSCALSAA